MIPTYTITPALKPRGFSVTDASGQLLASMRQPGFFRRDMEGSAGGHELRIASEGFWRTRFGVFLNAERFGTIRTTAWGQLQWTLTFPDRPALELRFVNHVWRQRYQLQLAKDLPLLEIVPRFQWRSLSTTDMVQEVGPGIAPEQMPIMLALAGFCVRLMRARAHASAT